MKVEINVENSDVLGSKKDECESVQFEVFRDLDERQIVSILDL